MKFILLKGTIQWVLICSQSCVTITTMQFQNDFITPKRNLYPLTVTPVTDTLFLLPFYKCGNRLRVQEAHPEPPSELRGRAGYWAVPCAPWGDGSVWEAFERMSTYWPKGGPSPNSRHSALRPSPLALQS